MVQRKVIVRGATNQALDELDAADIPDLAATYEAAGAVTAHTGDTSAAHAASAISYAPGGTISATDVQAAIEEVLAEAAGGGAPTNADYLVGTAHAGLSAEIVVGTSPGGELGGTWASPTVDATHSGSSHAGLSGQPGSTDVAVADGGTGASTAAAALTNLGAAPAADLVMGRPSVSPVAAQHNIPGTTWTATVGTDPMVANVLRYDPIFVPSPITIDAVMVRVTTGAASSNIRAGLYNADADWQPTTLFKDAGAAASTSNNTTLTLSFTALPMPAGRYLFAIVSDSNPTVRYFICGIPSPYIDSAMGNLVGAWRVAFTYGTLPTPNGTAWTTTTNVSNGYGVHGCLRVTSVP